MATQQHASRSGLIAHRILKAAAQQGRFVLLAGLIAGIALPGVAAWLSPFVPELVALLLFLNAFRSGNRIWTSIAGGAVRSLVLIAVLQLALPLLVMWVVIQIYGSLPIFWLAAVLMLSSPSLTGTPNFVAMLGRDPTDAMRLLVVGTLLFPAIAFVVLTLLPGIESGQAASATIRLALIILSVVVLGTLVRIFVDRRGAPNELNTLCDGASAILLCIVVVGLMAEVGPLFRQAPATLGIWLLGVTALNLTLQILFLIAFRALNIRETTAASVISGNRNTVLYLLALPPDITASIMLFIGCYQVPMYLTPMIMRRLHGGDKLDVRKPT